MKLSKTKLEQIIEEELSKLKEANGGLEPPPLEAPAPEVKFGKGKLARTQARTSKMARAKDTQTMAKTTPEELEVIDKVNQYMEKYAAEKNLLMGTPLILLTKLVKAFEEALGPIESEKKDLG